MSVTNGLLEGKERQAAEARASCDWFAYLYCYEKGSWPDLLESIRTETAPEEWAKAVQFAWVYSDEIWINLGKWRAILAHAKGLKGLMNDNEVATLERQEACFTIYRGCNEHNVEGLSWSLDPKWARETARASAGDEEPDRIVKGTAFKSDVLAYFEPHGEEYEIVIFPELVADKTVLEYI